MPAGGGLPDGRPATIGGDPLKASRGLACAVLLALGLYLATLSRNWTADSLLYALDIESGEVARMVDPYHLLLHPLGWAFYRLWRWAGWSGGALLPSQVLNALGGAACVGLVYGVARHLTGSARAAALAAAGMAVSGGLWLLSVEAEFVTIPLAAHLAVLWGALAAPAHRARRPAYALGLGLGVVLSALTYLTGVLLLGVAAAGLLLRMEWPRPVRLRQAAIAAGTVLVVTAAGLLCGILWSRGALAQWPGRLLGGGVYGQLSWTSLPRGAYAFLRSLALYPNLAMNDSTRAFLASAAAPQRALFVLYYLAVLAVAMAPPVLAWRWRHVLWAEHRRELAVLGTWVALFGAFAVYWVPGDVSFWVPLLAAWWLLAALVMVPRLKHGRVSMATAVLLLLAANGLLAMAPRRDLGRNVRYTLAQELAGHTAPADLILLGDGDGLEALYAVYFGRRQVVSLPLEGADLPAVGQWFGGAVRRVRQRGGRILAAGYPRSREPGLEQLCASAARALDRPCPRLLEAWQLRGDSVWELCPRE